jgi:hypothetical protein
MTSSENTEVCVHVHVRSKANDPCIFMLCMVAIFVLSFFQQKQGGV